MKHPILALAALSVSLFPACATTGSRVERGSEPMTNREALVLYSAGIEEILVDPRDRGLGRAFAMLEERLLELAGELGEEDLPRPLARLVADALVRPMSLRVDVQESLDWSAGPPIRAQLAIQGTAAEVESMATRVQAQLPAPGEPSTDHAGLRVYPVPQGALYLGARRGTGEGGDESSSFIASWGEPFSAELGLGSLDLPRGVAPALAFKLDMAKLQAPLEMVLSQAGEGAALLRRNFEYLGFLADPPVRITAACGYDDERGHVAARYTNYVPVMQRQGLFSAEPLRPEELRLVPADATLASMSRLEWSGFLTAFQALWVDQELDPLQLFRDFVGIDLQADVFAHLGSTSGLYMSDTTGGGGLASLVMFISLRDEARMIGSLEIVSAFVEDLAAERAGGRVSLREWAHDGARCWSLTFPGLPIPLELSLAVVDGYLFKAATPQALVGAVDHMRSGAPGLTDTRSFRSNTPGSLADLLGFSYMDTERLLAEGYGYAALLSSALANGVRSPANTERNPGLILPPFPELSAGAVPSVMVYRLEGEDLVYGGQIDRSLVANATAFLGTPYSPVLLSAVGAAVLIPRAMMAERAQVEALLQAEEAARLDELLREQLEANREELEAQERDDEGDG